MMTKKEWRAFLVAPLVVPFVFVIGITGLNFDHGFGDFFSSIFITASFGLPIAYVLTYTLGLLFYLVFKKISLINSITLPLGGIFIANIPLIMIWIFGGYDQKLDSLMETMKLFTLIGLSTGVVFWMLVRKCFVPEHLN